jgi:dipeptidyl aminopeptidase/acylaminoacyl peptidase
MNKKAIAILGAIFILIVGTLGVIIYLRSTGKDEAPAQSVETPPVVIQEPEVNSPDSEIPPSAPASTAGAIRLIDEAVITPALFFQGNGIAYFNRQGQLFRTDMAVSGSTVLLSNKTEITIPSKTGISKILWPLVGQSFIAESGVGLARRWSYYNPEIGQYVELPRQVKSLSWMPSGTKIVFVWVDDNGKATLNIANPDTSEYQVLSELYDNDIEIMVSPDGNTIAYYRNQTNNLAENGLFTVSIDGKTWGTITREGYNRGVLWSPDSRKLLFTKRDLSGNSTLWMADLASAQVKSLGVNSTETKAVWTRDSQSVVVAVPGASGVGSGQTSDSIVKINVVSGSKTEFSLGSGIDAQELFMNLEENILFFVNAQNGSLYYLPLTSSSSTF